MTEEEAKTKSCCGPMQAEYGKTHVVNCIGSACMAWRSKPARSVRVSAIEDEMHFPAESYCGLAGKP